MIVKTDWLESESENQLVGKGKWIGWRVKVKTNWLESESVNRLVEKYK